MQVVGHVIDGDHLLLLPRDDTRDEFLEFIVMYRLDEALPSLNRKYNVDVDLCIGVCRAQMMSLLTELESIFGGYSTKMPLRRSLKEVRNSIKPIEERGYPRISR